MIISVQALEAPLSTQEIRDAVGKEKLALIQGKGKLAAYTIAHEGKTSPKSLNDGSAIKLSWGKKVIQALGNIVKKGTKFFFGHGDNTNSHEGRKPLGEIVGTLTKEIGGRLSQVIIGHFPDSSEVEKFDIVSMEAVIDTTIDNVVNGVRKISGIAMESSDRQSPAFPGAVRLAQIQAFEEETKTEVENLKNSLPDKEKHMTFEEVKQGIRELNIFPHQVFNMDDMKADRTFGKILEENTTLKTNNSSLQSELEKAQDQIKEVGKKSELVEAKDTFDSVLKGDGFTDKQRNFMSAKKKHLETLTDLSEEGVNKFIDSLKEEYATAAQIFGVTEDGVADSATTQGEGGGKGDTSEVEDVVNNIMRGD